MIKFEMTYNGKPFDPDDFSNDILKAIMDLTKNQSQLILSFPLK